MIRKIDSNIFSLTILKVTTFSRIRQPVGINTIEKHALLVFISAILSPYDELFNIKQNFKMKKYMPFNGLRWSRDSGSAHYDTPQTAVFGRAGGGDRRKIF